METPAAALIRRTDTPSWPNCLRQLRVASTNASRRTAGVARWNFGTCRLVAICFPFFGLYPSGAEWPLSRMQAPETATTQGPERLRREGPESGYDGWSPTKAPIRSVT